MLEKKIIVIVAGPTAVGKTEYAIKIAQSLNGEIVSADSMQLYKYLDIGSAKPDSSELSAVNHYLIDAIDPTEDFSVAKYQVLAQKAIDEIFEKGKIPIISGGTGLYINSLIYDMDFASSPLGDSYRRELEKKAEVFGNAYVHAMLAERSPALAEKIHQNNVRKTIRALEVLSSSGREIKPFDKLKKKIEKYDVVLIGLTRERQLLYDRINRRVDKLIDMGLKEEVETLLSMGLTEENISMKGIGYKEIIGYLRGEYGLEQGIYLIKRNSRHYAKRQLTWFRRYDEMKWFDLSSYENDETALKEILEWVKNKSL